MSNNPPHMWTYWRDKYCDPVVTVQEYYPEILNGDTDEGRDMRAAISAIRNASRVRDASIRRDPHMPKFEREALAIIQVNRSAIDQIMLELADNAPDQE